MVEKEEADKFVIGVLSPLVATFLSYSSAHYLLIEKLAFPMGGAIALVIGAITFYKAFDVCKGECEKYE
jgi:hypothetical protein